MPKKEGLGKNDDQNHDTGRPESDSVWDEAYMKSIPTSEHEAWLSAIVNSAEDAIVGKTLDGTIVSWNPAAVRLFGYGADEIVGRPVSVLADPARPTEMAEILNQLRQGRRVGQIETTRMRKDGSIVPVALTISPIQTRKGELIGASKIARDISEKKKTDEQLRLLSADLEHRTKNLLSIVVAMVHRITRDAAPQLGHEIEGRIMALDRVNSLLRENQWRRAGLSGIFRDVLRIFSERGDAVILGGPPVSIIPESVQILALMVYELGTNAVKYGALSPDGGQVEIIWELIEDGIRIRWQERGVHAVRAPLEGGTGLEVIRRSVEGQLEGTISMNWQESGLTCEITLPMQHIQD